MLLFSIANITRTDIDACFRVAIFKYYHKESNILVLKLQESIRISNISFEEIREEHLDEVLCIYNHYILNTTATFHAHAFSRAELKELVFFDNPRYGTYVIKENGEICGYVLLTQHKKREAYDGTAEVTVYLKPDSVGKGTGSMALRHIEQVAKDRGIHVLIATICGENSRSIGLFQRNDYARCAHYREVGQKFGQLLDVVAYQKILS